MPHVGGQEGKFGIHVHLLVIPPHETVYGEGSAQLVHMRRAVGTVAISDLRPVDSQMPHCGLKIPAGRTWAISSALGQDEEKWPRGRDAKQALAQFEEGLEIGGCPAANRNQTILVELGRLNKQGALRGRIVGHGDADAFGDAQTASIEEMIQNIAGTKPEGS